MLTEARLPDLLIDLHNEYGMALPRPGGSFVQFSVIDEDATYGGAKARLEALLARHRITVPTIEISPGPDAIHKVNRKLTFRVNRSSLM